MTERRPLPTAFEVAIGAHLHDIGKFMQRAVGDVERLPRTVQDRMSDVLPSFGGRHTHVHALFSDAFFEECVDANPLPAGLDARWIRDCAVYHHKPLQDGAAVPNGSITWLVAEADRIAAGMERKKADEDQESSSDPGRRGDYRRTRLVATPTTIWRETAKESWRFYPVAELAPDRLFELGDDRKNQATIDGYVALWPQFKKAYAALADRAGDSVDAYVEGLIALSERFCWSIPSSTIDDPDVSLHDHGRVAAAVAACLHLHHQAFGDLKDEAAVKNRERPKFRLLIGDLSGIQASLFRLKSEGVKGLARLLRGRSFRMQLIGEAAARRACAAFGLTAFNVIQLAGGRCQILVPETGAGEAERIVGDLRGEIDAWMREQYVGDLVLNLALTEPVSARDLIEEVHNVYAQIGAAADTAKLRPLQTGALGVVDLPFDRDLSICESCGVRPAATRDGKDEKARCRACEAETRLGRRLPKAHAIAIGDKGHDADGILGLDVSVLLEGDRAPQALGFRKRGLPMTAGMPAADRFFEAYTPRHSAESLADSRLTTARLESGDEGEPEEGGLLTFAELAAYSRREVNGRMVGRPMLALLKADVDNLGVVFSAGLGTRRSLSRTAALSRLMDAFFTGWLPEFLSRDFPRIYTVYAGGDDMMLLGPWHDVLRFSERLRERFGAFAGGNPALTLSAGIALFDPRSPISVAAREADDRLGEAKDPRNRGKDRIGAVGPIGNSMTWSDWRLALEQAEELDRLIAGEKVSTALLYRLLALADRRDRARTDPTCADWRAQLGYTLFRTVKADAMAGNRTVREHLMGLMGVTGDMKAVDTPPAYARIAITIALYRNR